HSDFLSSTKVQSTTFDGEYPLWHHFDCFFKRFAKEVTSEGQFAVLSLFFQPSLRQHWVVVASLFDWHQVSVTVPLRPHFVINFRLSKPSYYCDFIIFLL